MFHKLDWTKIMPQCLRQKARLTAILILSVAFSSCGDTGNSVDITPVKDVNSATVSDTQIANTNPSNRSNSIVTLVPEDVDTDWSYGRNQLNDEDLPPFLADVSETARGSALVVVGRRDIYQRRKVAFDESAIFKFEMTVRQTDSTLSKPIRQLSSFYVYDAEGNSQPFVVDVIEGSASIFLTPADGWIENDVTIKVTSPNAVWIRPAIRFNFDGDVSKSEILEVTKLEISTVE